MDLNIEKINEEYGDIRFTLFTIAPSKSSGAGSFPVLHDHIYYELHIIQKGSYTVFFPEGTLTINEGEMLIISPNKEHYSYIPNSPDSENTVINLSVNKTDSSPKIYDRFAESIQSRASKPIRVSKTFRKRAKAFSLSSFVSAYDQISCKHEASEIVFELFNILKTFKSDHASPKSGSGTADPAIMLNNLVNNNAVSLSDIAKNMGYSYRHTSRMIKKQYGMSLSEIRKQRALFNAAKLLSLYPSFPIKFIVRNAGFKNESLFYSAFKSKFKMTPNEFRERSKKRNEN